MKTLFATLNQPAWRALIEQRVATPTLQQLDAFLASALQAGAPVYPPQADWWRALNALAPDQVRVVIVGQDPYHGPGQAQGLSFSVPDGCKLPPSLRNYFKEWSADVGCDNRSGDLTPWLHQGVLLLNTVLTVAAGQAGSHRKQGWEAVTDTLIQALASQPEPIVFMLWGNDAEKKRALIPAEHHLILSAAHPSPLSAHRGWFGCGHFSATNQFLQQHGYRPIQWQTGDSEQLSLWATDVS